MGMAQRRPRSRPRPRTHRSRSRKTGEGGGAHAAGSNRAKGRRSAPGVEIVGTGSFLPGEPIRDEELEGLVGPLPPDVLEGIQVEQRHWIIGRPPGRTGSTTPRWRSKATRAALGRREHRPRRRSTCSCSPRRAPDYLLPPLVTFVQERLGHRRVLDGRDPLRLRRRRRGARCRPAPPAGRRAQGRAVVVIGSEAISPLTVPVFLGKDPGKVRMRDRLGIYNFGDGAGAMVLQRGRGRFRGRASSARRSSRSAG